MVKILERRDTAVNWALQNPVLAEGERGFDTTNGLFKIGNGVSTWDALPEYNHSCLVRMGLWDASTGSLPANPEKGWYYICSVVGDVDMGGGNHVYYVPGDWIIYNGTGWDKLNNSGTPKIIGTPYDLTLPAESCFCVATAFLGPVTITLPVAPDGTTITVVRTLPPFGTETVTLVVTSGDISGYSSIVLTKDYEAITLQSDAGSWIILSRSHPAITGLPIDDVELVTTTPYTVVAEPSLIVVQCSTENIVLDLPTTVTTGLIIKFKKIDSTKYTATLNAGSATIDGATTYVLEYQNEFVMLQWNSSYWMVIGE